MRTNNTFLSLAFLMVVGGALAGCGEEPIPEHVSYARDIKPLIEARCLRCHGAGGTLNRDPALPDSGIGDTPKNGYFNMVDADGLKLGLKSYGVVLVTLYVDKDPMPPPPAPPLTSREREMLLRWEMNPLP